MVPARHQGAFAITAKLRFHLSKTEDGSSTSKALAQVFQKGFSPMRLVSSILVGTILCSTGFTLLAQTPAGALPATAPTSAASPAISGSAAPSAMLQPAIDSIRQALGTVRLDKWKATNPIRDEADSNVGSIRRDIDSTLPPLLTAADGAPDSVTQVLPAFRNVNALYDVLLRVASAARVAAPTQQSAPLDAALVSLEDGRRALGDRLQAAAVSQERRISDLQAAAKAVLPPPPVATPTAAPVAAPVKKRAKPRVKPAAPTTPPAAAAAPAH
jgi:hypothetical protein